MRALVALLLLCLTAPQAMAGGLGVRVTSVSDMNLGGWNVGDPAINAHIDLCVYALAVPSLVSYAVTVTGSSGYNLVNGARQIPYTIYWDDSGLGNLGLTTGTQLSSGVKLAGRLNFNILSETCSGTGSNARLNLKITQAAMTAALAGTYTGSITILISQN